MIETGIDTRVKINQIVQGQLPSYVQSESPKTIDFLKQYYLSQDSQGSPADIIDNLDQYLKFDYLTPEVISGITTLTTNVSVGDSTIFVESTKGYPNRDGLFQVGNEIVYYTGITTNSFTGCVRGFSGITGYSSGEVLFSSTSAESHNTGDSVQNLSVVFLREFFRNLKVLFAPGFEDESFVENLNVNNFIKGLRTFYKSKGTEESFNILTSSLFGENSSIKDQSQFLIEPSEAEFRNRLLLVAEKVNGGDPIKLSGQTLYQDRNSNNSEIQSASAPISEVGFIIRGGKEYYNIYLFKRFSDPSPGFDGTFSITPSTKCIGGSVAGSNVITVDTTIGFPNSGLIVSGNNVITYTDKTITQFLNCSGIDEDISSGDDIRTNDVVYGFANDDNTKIELRLTGIINEFEKNGDIYYSDIGEVFETKTVGRKIKNPSQNKTIEQITFNSWIYNTASRIKISSFSGSTFVLEVDIDKAYLRNNDTVEIINRANDEIVVEQATVTVSGNNEVILSGAGIGNLVPNIGYDIRRKIKKATSSGIELEYGNNQLSTNVLNTYITEDNQQIYIASNSLPSYDIDIETIKTTIAQATVSSGAIQDQNALTGNYNILSFPSNVPFLTGDEVVYVAGTATTPLEGLEFGRTYYVEVLSPANRIKLYLARSFIEISDNVEFNVPSNGDLGSHDFVLSQQYNKKIAPQKLLKTLNLTRSFDTGNEIETIPGAIGMLVNGVEISNYKIDDKIYFGPLKSLSVINGGSGYDVVNPPKISISNPNPGGTVALANAAVRGQLKDILIDPQDFGINNISEISITGGNGSGAEVEPILTDVFREVGFSGKYLTDGGGVSVYEDRIVTLKNHNFKNGEPVVYNPNGNPSIPITGFGQTNITGNFLETGGVYYTEIVSPTSFRIYDTISDFNGGINTIGFSTGSTSGGLHLFRLRDSTKQLTGVNIINPGSGYENRQVAIKTTGISTITNSFIFTNHGYNTGELITYSTTGAAVTGLTTSNQYYVSKIDNNTFRVSDAGIGGTDKTNFDRGLIQKISGIGTGLHIFNYPQIEVNVIASIANTVGVITATPIVTGEIVDSLLYEKGSSYGTKILNFEKRPLINVLTGSGAEFRPIIQSGKIINILVTDGGSNYFSPPDLIISSLSGNGASARCIIDNEGKVISVIVLKEGTNYSLDDTFVTASPRGSGAFLNTRVRDLTINNRSRFTQYNGETVLDRGENGLEFSVVGYNENLANIFQDTNPNAHSPLIGWAYDGNPIYGSYGYTDSVDSTSNIKLIESGYEIDISQVENRPSGFQSGIFVEDYSFKASGDLDVHNGRFTKTPEFPNGVYAYFATLTNDPLTGDPISSFPYFIGNTYRSDIINVNLAGASFSITQDFDFNNSNLIRNTYPYIVNDDGADYDFFIEPYKIDQQRIIVNSKGNGGVDSVEVINAGSGYKVGDDVVFDVTEFGGGAGAEVSELIGNNVTSITNEFLSYDNFVFERISSTQIAGYISTYHDLEGGNIVNISGLSTFISGLDGNKKIGVPLDDFRMLDNMPAELVGGIVTDIAITPIPEYLRPNTEFQINNETLTVLNVFKPSNISSKFSGIIRAVRGISGTGHTVGSAITAKSNLILVDFPGDNFNSKANDVVYFNPNQVIGFGTEVGVSTIRNYDLAGVTTNRSIPTQSIFIQSHPFTNNQKAFFVKPSGKNPVSVSTVGSGVTFNLPESGDSQIVYLSNIGKNLIGIKTTLDSSELFFNDIDSPDYQYYIVSNNQQITGNIKRLTSRVSTSSTHGLQVGDSITFTAKSNLSVGIGTSANIKVLFEESIQNIIVNPIGFTSSFIGLSSSKIFVDNHGLVTGDLVFYNASELPGGIETGKYFVYSGDENSFSLAETIADISGDSLNLVPFTSIGGTSHTISKVNPQIKVINNNDLVFDVSDSSLSGYDFKIYYDQAYRNRLVGTGRSSIFEVVQDGTVGVGTTIATVTIKFNEFLPEQLYYNIERTSNNVLVEPDISSRDHSRILYTDSVFSGKSNVVGVTSTSFLISLNTIPEKDFYLESECDELSYVTNSKTALGGISKIKMLSNGNGYDQLPGISTITTEFGRDSEVVANSRQIGVLKTVEVKKSGFDFSVDKTLRPIADIPTYYTIKNFKKVSSVVPIFGGRNFVTPPELVLINSVTKEEIQDAELIAVMGSGAIDAVEVISPSSGLSGVGHSVYTVTNSNGINVISADSVNTGIMTLTVVTPILGFSTNPLNPGDQVFVGGIGKYGDDGDGFNSRDYGFTFFEVQSFNGGIVPSTVTIDLSGISTNPGIAVTSVNFGTIVKKENYPTFTVSLEDGRFILNETLIVRRGVNNIRTDLKVTKSDGFVLKTLGEYELVIGDVVTGELSGNKATIESIERFDGFYNVNHGSNQNFGWSNNKGFLNEDSQVIPDNDYYQKLAYSIKSPIEFEDLIDPVNRLTHIAGTKNFADTEIKSSGIAITNYVEPGGQSLIIDLFNESDVTTINNFDFAVDTNVVTNSPQATNSIKFGNKKLTSYIECRTNRVLAIDDISADFIDSENTVAGFKDILSYPDGTGMSRFIIIITDVVDITSYEVHEVVILSDGSQNSFILEKSRIKANPSIEVFNDLEKETLGEISSFYDNVAGTLNLRFTPSNPQKTYDIKAFRQLFDSRTSGIGSVSVGDTELFGSTVTLGAGATSHLIGVGISFYNSLFAYVEITNLVTSERDYAELSILHDGINAYLGEYGFNTTDRLLSFNPIGTFGVSIDSNVLHLNYSNNSANSIRAKGSIVGFKTTNVGLRSSFFKLETQLDGSERTARIESNVIEESITGLGITVVGITSLTDRLSKSIVRVSSGNTQSLSQVLMTQDFVQGQSFIVEYPQIGVNTSVGLGTFSSRYNGTFTEIVFNPDSKYIGDNIRIEEFSEIIYSDQDTNILQIPPFGFGTVIEEVVQSRYTPNDRTTFELTYEGFPIFARRFNPQNPTVFDTSTGNIFIESHFLNSGQEIVYSPGSTIIGVNSESIGIGTTLSGGGSVVGDIRENSTLVSSISANSGVSVGEEFFGPGVGSGATIVSIGSSFRFFIGNSDGTNVITSVANTSVLSIGDTIRELVTETGFGTITSIGINSITVDNNVPVGVGSTYYSETLGIAISMSIVATATTFRQTFTSGITTDILPSNLFAIRIDNNNIKLAAKKDFALSGIGIVPTTTGSGNNHLIDTTKKIEKSLIILDGVVQSPIARTLIEYELQENIGISKTFFPLSGISTLTPDYVLRIEDELMNITNVGIGTSSDGPISGIGTFNLVNVIRGYVGTDAAPHADGSTVILNRGAYNIVESTIHFVDPPKGAGADFILDERNLEYTRSNFSGRVFLRLDYNTNEIYDDISPEFTGIAKTFTLTINGGNYPTGLDTSGGSGVLFINGIHQGQTTDNNPSNVYSITASPSVVDLEFSGVKLLSGDSYLSDTDSVLNQLPRGGTIVSFASSGGIGIAPLVSANVIANVSAGGSITEIVGVDTVGTYSTITDFVYDHISGIATVTTSGPHGLNNNDFVSMRDIELECTKGYDNLLGISTAVYNEVVGIITITTTEDHNLNRDMQVRLANLQFSCAAPHSGVTTTIFPDGTNGRIFNTVTSIVGPTTFTTNVGISTIAHTYEGGGTVETGITTTKFPDPRGIPFAIENFEYDKTTGFSTITTKKNHSGISIDDQINLSGIAFTCPGGSGITTTIFPDGTQGNIFKVFDIPAPNQIITNVGISTIDHIYDDHGIVFGVKYANPYNIRTIISPTQFEVDVFKVGFAHTYISGGEVSRFYQGLSFGSGYFGTAEVEVFEEGHTGAAATITATVGVGGTLSFNVVGTGAGYTNPTINVSDPSYANLPIEGVSRRGIGNTTDTGKGLTVSVIPSAGNATGIGTTVFVVKNFSLNSPGFSFKKGDVFRPVGVVTAAGIGTAYEEFVIEVLEVFNDEFSSWNFGQIDYIDSIRSLQDGFRTRFPLNLNGNSLSFQKDPTDQRSVEIDLDAILLLFVNGVVQIPKKDYFFEGGTSFNFNFTSPPGPEDNISIYFYRGTRGVDSEIVTVFETLKPGDNVQLLKYDPNNTPTQKERTVFSIIDSSEIETNVYRDMGIDDVLFRPINLTKQKRDLFISEEPQYKIRDSLQSQIMPVGKVIGDFSASDTEIFLDDSRFFQYEEDAEGSNIGEIVCDALVVDYNEPVSAAISAIVSETGTISSLVINNGGSGYSDGSVPISIAAPARVDNAKFGIIGVGTTATATASATNGIITSVSIVNTGLGYTNTNPPQVIVEVPQASTDTLIEAPVIVGYSGIITGISTTTGSGGHPLAIKFQVDLSNSGSVILFPNLLEGYPIFVKNTVVGSGVTSVNNSDSEIIGIGTENVDNIYILHEYTIEGSTGIMTCNIKSDTIGIASTTGINIGQFSWGKLSGFQRSTNPISLTVTGKTFDVGLTTYPSVTRRGVGLRNTGNISKKVFL